MNILLTNDDGIHFPGILALQKAFSSLGRVYLFGPHMEKSATSQAMTLFEDLYVKPLDPYTYIVNGYPVDCVNVALHGDLANTQFDLLISGINKGVNMGEDVLYSGTVGAARHGLVHGIPSIAVSSTFLDENGDFDSVAGFLLDFVKKHRDLLSKPVLLNINYPGGIKKPEKIKWTKLGRRIYRDKYKRVHAEDGAFLFNLGGSQLDHEEAEGTDFQALEEGYVSVTPLKIDATDYGFTDQIKR